MKNIILYLVMFNLTMNGLQANGMAESDSCIYSRTNGNCYLSIYIESFEDECKETVLSEVNQCEQIHLVIANKGETISSERQLNGLKAYIERTHLQIRWLELNVNNKKELNHILLLFKNCQLDRLIISIRDSLILSDEVNQINYVGRLDILSDSLLYLDPRIGLINGLTELNVESYYGNCFPSSLYNINTLKIISLEIYNSKVNGDCFHSSINQNHNNHIKLYELFINDAEINLTLSYIDTIDVLFLRVSNFNKIPKLLFSENVTFTKIIISYDTISITKIPKQLKGIINPKVLTIAPSGGDSANTIRDIKLQNKLKNIFKESEITVLIYK